MEQSFKRRPDWTLEEMRILRELYPDNNTEDLLLFINRSCNAINIKAHKLDIKKTDAFMNSPRSGRFIKKETPWFRKLWERITRC